LMYRFQLGFMNPMILFSHRLFLIKVNRKPLQPLSTSV
jgi:hypothetical protein